MEEQGRFFFYLFACWFLFACLIFLFVFLFSVHYFFLSFPFGKDTTRVKGRDGGTGK